MFLAYLFVLNILFPIFLNYRKNRNILLVILAVLFQNLYRICHVGRNRQTRVLGITTDLALIDSSFIRLCQQRYHARIGIEENAKRKFKNYYGKRWLEVTEKLNVGEFVYLNKNQLQKIKIPLFQSVHKPQNLNELNIKPSVEMV